MRCVILESPFAGDVAGNIKYAKACVRDCLTRGEGPIASHLLFTQPGILDDTKKEERALGIGAGHAWYPCAEAAVVYLDRGMSSGMIAGIKIAHKYEVPVEIRFLPGYNAEDYNASTPTVAVKVEGQVTAEVWENSIARANALILGDDT